MVMWQLYIRISILTNCHGITNLLRKFTFTENHTFLQNFYAMKIWSHMVLHSKLLSCAPGLYEHMIYLFGCKIVSVGYNNMYNLKLLTQITEQPFYLCIHT